jgi:small subunit ribosomal protein S1
MKAKVAKNTGFCGGVQRAFILVENKFKRSKDNKRVLILGSLVHNENVAQIIGSWGIRKIKTFRNVKRGDTVIITAHGVSKLRIDKLKDKGARVFDVTCPKVSKVHRTVSDHYKKGYDIIIYGDRKHKEVKGINGWCNNRAQIVESESEIGKLVKKLKNSKNNKPILLVSQTTQNVSMFKKAGESIKRGAKASGRSVKMINTICSATFMRQAEAKEFAHDLDGIVVVGGKKSANTRQLWKIAKSQNKNVVWIEQLNKMSKNRIKNSLKNAKKAGILSGASTPPWDIEQTAEFMRSL